MPEIYVDSLQQKLSSYKKKFYINLLLKGSIISLGLIFSVFIAYNLLEYFGNFSKPYRFILFFSFIAVALFSFSRLVAAPLLKLLNPNRQISDEEAAMQIGSYFPEVNDKLLNIIQLKKSKTEEDSLVMASIAQKAVALRSVPVLNAIDLQENSRYGKYILIPIFIICIVAVFAPRLFIDSTARIIHFDKHYAVPAPFRFVLTNKQLDAFRNEDFKISLQLEGKALPQSVYIFIDGKKMKMQKEAAGEFSYWIRDIQKSEEVAFEGAGFLSDDYMINVKSRPAFGSSEAYLSFPAYLRKKDEVVKNVGNLILPQGTSVTWNFRTENTEVLNFTFNEAKETFKSTSNTFSFTKKVLMPSYYKVHLEKDGLTDNEQLSYFIDVIPDEYPRINLSQYKDSTSYSFISLAGTVSDDHGITQLKLFYKKNTGDNKSTPYKAVNVPVPSGALNHSYLYNWVVDSLHLNPGQSIQYYLQVWDNDGVHGSKSAKTSVAEFKLPSKKEIREELDIASNNNEKSLESLLSQSTELQKNLDKIGEKLKNKNNLDWQDKKALDDVLKQHEQLKKEINELSQENKNLINKTNKFQEQDQDLTFKMNQLQKLMDELLDEDTKKLYNELEKLLNDQASKNEIEKLIAQLQKKDDNLQNELERALEMFKQLKFDQKLTESVNELKELAKEQKELSEKTQEKSSMPDQLGKEQEELNKSFEDVKQNLEELSDLNKELDNQKELDNIEPQEEDIQKSQKTSSEQLSKGQNKKAAQSQKEASEKMDQLASKLSEMQQEGEMEEMEENLHDLRAILENLITLSFEQEALMKELKKVNQTDPRFITLSQQQLKLKDDSKIVEDSLLSLAKRVFQIESFVTREVSEMKDYMSQSTESLKNRRPEIATGKQQFAMTSINNLALLLNDVLKQMQEQMANAMKSGSKMCNKPGKKPGKTPGLGDLQKQLNEKIQELGKSGQSGKSLSESLAKLAAQQEMIRKALKELENSSKGEGGKQSGNGIKELSKEMEQTETDLVNKNLTQQTLFRQKEILTRLLEAEKSARERELDQKREAQSPDESIQSLPPLLQDYLRMKQKEIDLLKTISPQFTPYYKQEVNDYFQKIEN